MLEPCHRVFRFWDGHPVDCLEVADPWCQETFADIHAPQTQSRLQWACDLCTVLFSLRHIALMCRVFGTEVTEVQQRAGFDSQEVFGDQPPKAFTWAPCLHFFRVGGNATHVDHFSSVSNTWDPSMTSSIPTMVDFGARRGWNWHMLSVTQVVMYSPKAGPQMTHMQTMYYHRLESYSQSFLKTNLFEMDKVRVCGYLSKVVLWTKAHAWEVLIYAAGFPCTPFSSLHWQSLLLEEAAAKPMYRVLDNLAACAAPAPWLIQEKKHNYNHINQKRLFWILLVPLCFQIGRCLLNFEVGMLENVQGFKKVKPEFEKLLEEKLPGHHDSELLLHVCWRCLIHLNFMSLWFFDSGISMPTWISMRVLVARPPSNKQYVYANQNDTNLGFRS